METTNKKSLPDKILSETFWKAYREDFRAYKIFNSKRKDNIDSKFKKLNPTSKLDINTLVEGVVNRLNEENEQNINLDEERAKMWSPQNKQMV